MYLRLDRTEWQRELFGNLLVGELAEVAEFDQLAVARCHTVEVVLDAHPLLQADHALFGRGYGRSGGYGRVWGQGVNREILVAFAHEIDKGVASDGIEPLTKGVSAVIAVQVDEDFDKGLLQQVIDIADIAHTLQIEATYRLSIAGEEVLERAIIARKYPIDQLRIVGYDIILYRHTVSSL